MSRNHAKERQGREREKEREEWNMEEVKQANQLTSVTEN